MRYIRVPFPVALVNPITKEPTGESQSFTDLAFVLWLNDVRAGETPLRLVRWAKVVDAFRATKPGGVIALEDEDFATLKAIVEKPAQAFPPLLR